MGIMNKDKGLREAPYMKSSELIEWMKLACLVGELDACAEETKKGTWRSWLKCARGMIWKVIDERGSMLDAKQWKSVIRRRQHSKIKMITSDEDRVPGQSDTQEHVTVAYEDLIDLTDLALNSCAACPQGECVKDCFYAKVMFRLGLPVCRDDVKDGECPFSWLPVGETRQIQPKNQRNEHYYEEDYVI